jgi:hypothetical protein
MLEGEYLPDPPPSPAGRVLRGILLVRIGLLLLPWALMCCGLILVGAMALGPIKKDIPELWICLPAGLALLGALVGVPLWLWWRSPPWVWYFAHDGALLFYRAGRGREVRSRPLAEISEVAGYTVRGQGVIGYRITFRDGGSVILSRRVTGADELAEELRRGLGARGSVN